MLVEGGFVAQSGETDGLAPVAGVSPELPWEPGSASGLKSAADRHDVGCAGTYQPRPEVYFHVQVFGAQWDVEIVCRPHYPFTKTGGRPARGGGVAGSFVERDLEPCGGDVNRHKFECDEQQQCANGVADDGANVSAEVVSGGPVLCF